MLSRKLMVKQHLEFSGCVIRCKYKNGHQEGMCLIKIRLHSQNWLIFSMGSNHHIVIGWKHV